MFGKRVKPDNEHSKVRFRRRSNDVVGIDFSSTATKLVRLKRTGEQVSLVGLEVMPALDFDAEVDRFDLPRKLTSYYCNLCYSGVGAVIRILHTPLRAEETAPPTSKLRELLNVKSDFRVASYLLRHGKGRLDSNLLAVAIPQDDVNRMLGMFPSGPPAPASLEVSGLSVITAFLHARGEELGDETVCLIETGENTSTFAFLNRNEVFLVGKQNFGVRVLRDKISKDLEVDNELAMSILSDHSINISASLSAIQSPFIKQISISKDFVERHEGVQISKVYLSGGLSLLSSWSQEVEKRLNSTVVQWSPLENIQVGKDILSDENAVQITRFSAAVGAALGGLLEQ